MNRSGWQINDEPLPARGFVQIRDFYHYTEIARLYKTGKAKYYGLGMLPEDTQRNARAIAQVPRMVKLLEAIEAEQKDGINRGDWILSEVNSVLAEIRGK